jgi:Protein-glutamine gamma-glutamyltransferase
MLMRFEQPRVLLAALALCGALPWQAALAASEGIAFTCEAHQLDRIQADMAHYLKTLGIQAQLVDVARDAAAGMLRYSLIGPPGDTSTLSLYKQPRYAVGWDTVMLPGRRQRLQAVRTSSRKEIVLALMQHGRQTVFAGQACSVQALKDHVGLRQNIVAWSEHLHWGWPNGGSATWNTRYWHKGTPDKRWPLDVALHDVFVNQRQYGVGCYTATKLVIVQAVVDYYRRVKHDPVLAKLVVDRLMGDHEPLVDVEPPAMWAFEDDFDRSEAAKAGKLVRIHSEVAARNFVPGDWLYMLNTDPVSRQKTGYEGSNAVYLGRNRFDDYYNDHAHSYTYEEKLGEVYQWRHGVFSRLRDAAKIQPLTQRDFEQLGLMPALGGLVQNMRVVPYLFGYETLPYAGTPPANTP